MVDANWATACQESTDNGAPYRAAGSDFSQRFLTLGNGKFQLVVPGYTAAGCTSDKVAVLVTLSGTYAIGGISKAADQDGTVMGSDLDLTVSDGGIMPVTADAAGLLNASGGYCGKTTWQALQHQAIQGLKCANALLEAGIVPFDVGAIKNGQLILGAYYQADGIGASGDNRPTAWSWNEEFSKTTASAPSVSPAAPPPAATPTPTPTPAPAPTPAAGFGLGDLVGQFDVGTEANKPYKSLRISSSSDGYLANFTFEWPNSNFFSGYDGGTNQGAVTLVSASPAAIDAYMTSGDCGGANCTVPLVTMQHYQCQVTLTGTKPTRSVTLACGGSSLGDTYSEVATGTGGN